MVRHFHDGTDNRVSSGVLLEFTIGSEQFKLGSVLSSGGDLHFELERIVPTAGHILPFVWVSTDEGPEGVLPRSEERVGDSVPVLELLALDRVDDGGLYRIEWQEQTEGLIQALAETEATALASSGDPLGTKDDQGTGAGGLLRADLGVAGTPPFRSRVAA